MYACVCVCVCGVNGDLLCVCVCVVKRKHIHTSEDGILVENRGLCWVGGIFAPLMFGGAGGARGPSL